MTSIHHEYCWNLLPWFVTGRVSASDAQRIERHLTDCSACQTELEQQRTLCEEFRRDEPVMLAPQASLQKLLARIDASVPDAHLDTPGTQLGERVDIRPARRAPRWLAIAAAIQTVAIAALLTVLWQQTSAVMNASRFTTLTSPVAVSTPQPTVRIVFKPEMTTGELQSLLRSVDAQVLAGPSEAGVYTLQLQRAPQSPEMTETLTALRGNPRVIFAERVQGDTP